MKYPHITLGQIEAVWNKLGGVEGVREFLSGQHVVTSVCKFLVLSVDYNMSLEEMIAEGKYNRISDNLNTKKCPLKGEGIQGFEFDFVRILRNDSEIPFEDVIKELEKDSDPKNPWFAGRIEHLLSLGAMLPELQREIPIVAIGSVVFLDDGGNHVPQICSSSLDRILSLRQCAGHWLGSGLLLRVRRKL